MKRLISICIVCLLTASLLCSVSLSVAAGLDVTASAASVTEGQSVTVTLKYHGDGKTIAGIDGTIDYNTDIFTYVSCNNGDVEANGGAGKVRFVYEAPGEKAPGSLSVSFTFKAKKPGSCTFSVTTNEFVDDVNYAPLDAPKKSITVSAMATTVTNKPTLSSNANLKRLVPSKGTLTPKFDPKVTDYSVTVPYDVQSVTFSADSEDPTADISISGKSAVKVGKNTRVLTVTAPDGTTKKYNLTIIREEGEEPENTDSTDGTTTTTTLPQPPEDALDVVINDKPMTILDVQPNVHPPQGYRWSTLTINRVEVPAALNNNTGVTLLYLVGKDAEDNGFYLYDAQTDTFAIFRPFFPTNQEYLLYDLPDNKTLNGMTKGMLNYDGGQVTAYVYEDDSRSSYCVVWAALAGEDPDWYTYDKKERTLQRYHSTAAEGDASADQTDNSAVNGQVSNPKKDNGIAAFFKNNQQILIIGGVAIAGIVVIILLVVLLSSLGKHGKGKH